LEFEPGGVATGLALAITPVSARSIPKGAGKRLVFCDIAEAM
jgi:hypothetical protein